MSTSGAVATKLHDLVHASTATSLRIGPKSGKIMVSGCSDGLLSLWVLGKTRPHLNLSGHTSAITSLALDWPEDHVVAGCAAGPIKLWDIQQEKVARTLTGHREATTALEWHPYGDFFVSGGTEAVVKVWDVKKKGCIQTYGGGVGGGVGGVAGRGLAGGGGSVEVIRVTPDGKWIASGWEDGSVKIWDMTAGKLLKTFTDSSARVTCVAFSPVEFIMAVGYADGRVWFYDLELFDAIAATDVLGSAPHCVEFHKDGKEVLIACQDSIQVWSWDPLLRHDSAPIGWPNIADFKILEGNKLVGASLDQNMVGIWGIKVERLKPYKHAYAKPTKETPPLQDENEIPPREHIETPPQSISRAATPNEVRQVPTPEQQRPVITPRPQQQRPTATPVPENGHKRVSPLLHHATSLPTLAPTSDALSPTSETDLINTLSECNTRMTLTLQSRLTALQQIKSVWDETNVRPAVLKMVEEAHHGGADSGVRMDMLRVMNGRAKVFTLDVAILVLPVVNELLFEVYEDYIVEACNTIKLLCKSFGPLIVAQLGPNTISSPGIDLTREERQRKCVTCYHKLRDIQLTLTELAKSPGRIGASVQDALIELEFLGE
ncbi:WD repeat-containing protein 90 [Podochytrium sp. JEL0797]|nr:WD repeat-containing protein 90 [Podochytrium sp. JEL0797]